MSSLEDEVLTRLQSGEDSETEFKAGVPSLHDLMRELVAFANGREEGWVIIGVTEESGKGKIVGVEDLSRVIKAVQRAGQVCQPPIIPLVESVVLEEKTLVIVRVQGTAYEQPYCTKSGDYFLRQKAQSRKITEQEVQKTILAAQSILRRFYIRNYLSLQDTSLELGPVNLIIGPNGSGKTNLFKALRFVRDSLVGDIKTWGAYQKRGDELLWFGVDETTSVRPDQILLELVAQLRDFPLYPLPRYSSTLRWSDDDLSIQKEELRISEQIRFRREGKVVEASVGKQIMSRQSAQANSFFREYLGYFESQEKIEPFVRLIDGWRFINVNAVRARQRGVDVYADPKSIPPLQEDAGNLAEVLYALKRLDEPRFSEIIDRLGRAIGFPADVHVDYLKGLSKVGEARLAFVEKAFPGREISLEQISDGTIRLLAILTALLGDPQATLICLEEPDNGLHPHLMLRLADTIRSLVGVTTPSPQVLITTHSPEFMDCFDLTREAGYLHVYVAERRVTDGATYFRSVNEIEFHPWLEQYRLGEAVRRNVFDAGR